MNGIGLSYITTALMYFLNNRWKFTLEFDSERLLPAKLREYADVISREGSRLPDCWGFIDVTKR